MEKMTATAVVALTQSEQEKTACALFHTRGNLGTPNDDSPRCRVMTLRVEQPQKDVPTGVPWHPTRRGYAPQNFDATAKSLMPDLDTRVSCPILAAGNPIAPRASQ